MSINLEGEYEDSYQKEERLRGEMESVLADIGKFLVLLKRDVAEVVDAPNKFDSLEKRLDELKKQQADLDKELKAMQHEADELNNSGKGIDEKIDLNTALQEKFFAIRERITAAHVEMNLLLHQMEEIIEEDPAKKGDMNATEAIIKMKIRRAEEIKKELDELDK